MINRYLLPNGFCISCVTNQTTVTFESSLRIKSIVKFFYGASTFNKNTKGCHDV